jgi:hypothetical protein
VLALLDAPDDRQRRVCHFDSARTTVPESASQQSRRPVPCRRI